MSNGKGTKAGNIRVMTLLTVFELLKVKVNAKAMTQPLNKILANQTAITYVARYYKNIAVLHTFPIM